MFATHGLAGARLECDHVSAEHFGQYVYFLFITTTTVGYGDCVPIGWFRVIATGDAILGVVFAGLLVARITAELIDPFAVARMLEGVWFDHCILEGPDGTVVDELVSLIEFEKRAGQWWCSGRNHGIDGSVRHNFTARVTGFDGEKLYLSYNNDPAAVGHYTSGIWLLKLEKSGKGTWYRSYSFDLKHGVRDRSTGIKLHSGSDHTSCEAFRNERPGTPGFAEALKTLLEETRKMDTPRKS
jgi:hypothetical protein